jgi:Zn-dependent protease with chaperone function
VLFIGAVALITVAVYGVVVYALHELLGYPGGVVWWQPELFERVAAGVGIFVGLGGLIRTQQLKKGGAVVATTLGGRPVDPDPRDPDERRLVELVEQVALASGIPAPAVYVLDEEQGINAFAAGHDADDAVVAFTRGALEALDRDELLGVVAHEVGHIVNGDVRLDLRLVGVLQGILEIAMIGRVLLAASREASRLTQERNGSQVAQAVGGALVVIGYAGVITGRIIKASVSREREHLADASSARLTGDARGLARVLKKIAAAERGSRIAHPRAEEASHMFFARALGGIFSTHPPIEERIRRLEEMSGPVEEPPPLAEQVAGAASLVGASTPRHLERAKEILGAVPERLHAAAHTTAGARAVVYGLLAGDAARLDLVGEPPVVTGLARRLLPDLLTLPPELRAPLFALTWPALRRLSPDRRARCVEVAKILAEADGRVTPFELALLTMLRRLAGGEARDGPAREPTSGALSVVLSALAFAGHGTSEETRAAFAAGVAALAPGEREGVGLSPPDALAELRLDLALERLALASPRFKERLVAACARVVVADGEVTRPEADLLGVVAAALACPLPPFLD